MPGNSFCKKIQNVIELTSELSVEALEGVSCTSKLAERRVIVTRYEFTLLHYLLLAGVAI